MEQKWRSKSPAHPKHRVSQIKFTSLIQMSEWRKALHLRGILSVIIVVLSFNNLHIGACPVPVKSDFFRGLFLKQGTMRIERMTCRSAGGCSTTELYTRMARIFGNKAS